VSRAKEWLRLLLLLQKCLVREGQQHLFGIRERTSHTIRVGWGDEVLISCDVVVCR
jgi:hypothetical protein